MKGKVEVEVKPRAMLIPLTQAAKDVGLMWWIARTIVILKGVPVYRHHRYWLLDGPALEQFKLEVEAYREMDEAMLKSF